eukprot:tig00020553_g10518.t1
MRTRGAASQARKAYLVKLRKRPSGVKVRAAPAETKRPETAKRPDPLSAMGAMFAVLSQLVFDQTEPVVCRHPGCDRLTKTTPYCEWHLASDRGLAVRLSDIPNAGFGLFATFVPGRIKLDRRWWEAKIRHGRPLVFRAGDLVCKYDGVLIPVAQRSDRDRLSLTGRSIWALELGKSGTVVDASDTTAIGRYVNSAYGTGRKKNVRFSQNGRGAFIATEDIFDGDEILTKYGPAWMKTARQMLARAEKTGKLYEYERREDVPVSQAVRARAERAQRRGDGCGEAERSAEPAGRAVDGRRPDAPRAPWAAAHGEPSPAPWAVSSPPSAPWHEPLTSVSGSGPAEGTAAPWVCSWA